jgi:hypothetical protein
MRTVSDDWLRVIGFSQSAAHWRAALILSLRATEGYFPTVTMLMDKHDVLLCD